MIILKYDSQHEDLNTLINFMGINLNIEKGRNSFERYKLKQARRNREKSYN